MEKSVELLFVRHGESFGNVGVAEEGVSPDDPMLTPLGLIQAAKLAEAYCDRPIAAVYASALLRACQTVQPLAELKGLQVQVLRELMEVGTAIPHGDPERVRVYAPQAYASFVETAERTVRFPTQSGDPAVCAARAAFAADTVLSNAANGETVMVCTHGGFMGYLLRYCLGISLPERFNWQIDNCAVFHLRLSSVKIPKLVSANDISHLV